MKDFSVAIGIPHNGNNFVYPYVNSLIGLCLHEASKPPEERLLGSILPAGGCYIDDNRTKIAIDLCSSTSDTHVLMVDPDIEFSPQILELFKKHIDNNPEAKIIAGRVDLLNGLPVFYESKYTETGGITTESLTNTHQSFPFEGLKEFDLVGTGIILISRDVFVTLYSKGETVHFFHRVRLGKYLLGDDFSFCYRAKASGFKIYGAWDVYGIHHKIHPVPHRYLDKDDLEIKIK